MITEKDFYCQFHSYSNERLAKACCGITSIAMVLSAKGIFQSYTNEARNLDDFFCFINSLHKNNVPSVKRRFKFKNRDAFITLGFSELVKKEPDDVILDDGKLFPVFILYRGYDHRASTKVFEIFKIQASLKENISAEELYELFNSGLCSYFLASINSSFTDKDALILPTHIVVVQRTFEEKNGVKCLEYVDPAEKKFSIAVKTTTLDEFSRIFNRFGTLIK